MSAEEALRRFATTSPACVALLDRRLGLLAASAAWTCAFGAGPATPAAPPAPEGPVAPRGGRWEDLLARPLGDGRVTSAEAAWPRADGTRTWVRWTSAPWRGDDGEVGGLLVFAEDLGPARAADGVPGERGPRLPAAEPGRDRPDGGAAQAAPAPTRSPGHYLYQALSEALPDGLFLASADGEDLEANAAGCDLFGMDRAALGRRGLAGLVVAAERPRLRRWLAGLGAGEVRREAWRFQRSDAALFEGELVVYRLPDGRIHGAVRDVRAHRTLEALEVRSRAEERLLAAVGAALNPLEPEASLARLAELLAGALGDFCVVFVGEGRGGLRRAGVAARDPAHAPLVEQVRALSGPLPPTHPAARAHAERRAQRHSIRAEDYAFADLEAPALRAEASAKGLRFGVAVPLVVGPQSLGVVALSAAERAYTERDVHLVEEVARRAALVLENARLRAAEQRALRARDEVLGVVAHDLRNPLGSILVQAELLGRLDGEPERRSRRPAEVIRRAGARMQRIIDDLLDTTRLDAARLELSRAALAPAAVLREVAASQAPLAAARGLALEERAGAGLPAVWADHARVLQVFENLVGNALKFTERGTVTLGAEARAREVLFSVADTGLGIAAEAQGHVFDRFWQAPRARGPGAGLGLAIVKGLVEAHGGRVWVESEVGQGSTFFFTLPAGGPAPADPA